MGRLGIIVPTHDRPASLRRTLESVIPQFSARDNLLVVDNNPGPEMAAVCREFAPRVRCIREQQGPGTRLWFPGCFRERCLIRH